MEYIVNYIKANWWLELILVNIAAIVILLLLWLLYLRNHKSIFNDKMYLILSTVIIGLLTISHIIGHIEFLTNRFNGSAIFNVFTFIGIGITFLGVFLAYRQIHISQDKIYGYHDLYREMNSLLKEIDEGKGVMLQFSGQTLIPGQLSYENKEKIGAYREKIAALSENGRMKGKIEFITLGKELTQKAYYELDNEIINDKRWTKTDINKELEELKEFKKKIENQTVEINDVKLKEVIGNYYFSNGHTAIYATSLHYSEFRAKKKNVSAEEHTNLKIGLIGFKTTDRAIVEAFKDKFNKIKKEIEKTNKKEKNDPEKLCLYPKRICTEPLEEKGA